MKGKKHLVLAGGVLAVLFNLPPGAMVGLKRGMREVAAPFEGAIAGVAAGGRRLGFLRGGARVPAGVEEELLRLRGEVARLSQLDLENRHLRDALGFAEEARLRLAPCRVISRGDISGWWETLRVEKGAAEGIRAPAAVLTADGLVGRVTEVSEHTAEVLLLTDRSCRVSVRMQRSGALGILQGAGAVGGAGLEMLMPAESFRVEYIDKEADVTDGDEVVTSGLGGVYPEGVVVGRVEGCRLHRSGLYRTADVRPAADLGNLVRVYVVLGPARGGRRGGGA